MQRSFVAKSTVNFPDFELYVRVGDILVYNAANDNSLTIYRNGAIVKTIRTTPISIAAMLKTKMIAEVTAPAPKPVAAAPPAPAPAPKPVVKPKSTPKPKAVKSVNMRDSKGEQVLPSGIPAIDNPAVETIETLHEDGHQDATVKVSGNKITWTAGPVTPKLSS